MRRVQLCSTRPDRTPLKHAGLLETVEGAFSGLGLSRAAQITVDFRGTSCPTAADNGLPLRVYDGVPVCTEADGAFLDGKSSFKLGAFPFGGTFTIAMTIKKDSAAELLCGFGVRTRCDEPTLIAFTEHHYQRTVTLKLAGTQSTGILWRHTEVYDNEDRGSEYWNTEGTSDMAHV